uniref:AlNc14C179G8187 protein n=1 Tax=Albugo laibachii Nc14 TaxID=890382 RepID=F0WEL9_9STRA|nr:AlNc14C75G5069 [Albugo laibachii Nc14]CCA23083.1 AlNc14C179G8187 [Albugo laibachii Nc14]|eukprot:CCA23083.1 AlNc14C179G8187 [Albugo laibachii Nc14]
MVTECISDVLVVDNVLDSPLSRGDKNSELFVARNVSSQNVFHQAESHSQHALPYKRSVNFHLPLYRNTNKKVSPSMNLLSIAPRHFRLLQIYSCLR